MTKAHQVENFSIIFFKLFIKFYYLLKNLYLCFIFVVETEVVQNDTRIIAVFERKTWKTLELYICCRNTLAWLRCDFWS